MADTSCIPLGALCGLPRHIENFRSSGDNNIQSETPVGRPARTPHLWPCSRPQARPERAEDSAADWQFRISDREIGIGMNTTGVSVVETAFQTNPFPIRSILLYAEARVGAEFNSIGNE